MKIRLHHLFLSSFSSFTHYRKILNKPQFESRFVCHSLFLQWCKRKEVIRNAVSLFQQSSSRVMDHWKVSVWNWGLFSPPAWWYSFDKVYNLHWFVKNEDSWLLFYHWYEMNNKGLRRWGLSGGLIKRTRCAIFPTSIKRQNINNCC